MRAIYKHTAVLTLLLLAVMQVMPFVPAHGSCEAACCEKPVSCCEAEEYSGCDMAMTSCNIAMFIPMVSATLIKVDSNVQLDMMVAEPVANETLNSQKYLVSPEITLLDETAPPGNLPLLI